MSFKNNIALLKNTSISKSFKNIISCSKSNRYVIRNFCTLNNNNSKYIIDETVIKTPTPKDPHTDPHPEKPNKLDPPGGIPKKPKEQPQPFPNSPKKPKPSDFPIPDELYPQPI